MNETEALDIVEELITDRWIDPQTRVVAVDVNVNFHALISLFNYSFSKKKKSMRLGGNSNLIIIIKKKKVFNLNTRVALVLRFILDIMESGNLETHYRYALIFHTSDYKLKN